MKKLISKIALGIMLSFFAMSNAMAININTATKEELSAALYRVGPVTAERIVNARAQGPFKDEMDLQNRVMGIGPKLLEQNRMNIQFTDEEAAQAPENTPIINPNTGEPMATGTASPNSGPMQNGQTGQTGNQPQNGAQQTAPQQTAPQQNRTVQNGNMQTTPQQTAPQQNTQTAPAQQQNTPVQQQNAPAQQQTAPTTPAQ